MKLTKKFFTEPLLQFNDVMFWFINPRKSLINLRLSVGKSQLFTKITENSKTPTLSRAQKKMQKQQNEFGIPVTCPKAALYIR